VTHSIRERIEARERATLSPHAALAAESEGREIEEPEDPVRTCFQRDRDRILHSKSFRRLKGKTQVFIDPAGDHIRTRMTHTLEVAQISRTIGRALNLNEDLIEAIALGHDVGHTPFGHAGEAALDAAIRELGAADGPTGFHHDEQSLRLVQVLEHLNLCRETCLGIGGHSKGQRDLTALDGIPSSTLEAAVVRTSDRIAYMNHDLDDALRAGVIGVIPERFHLAPTNAKRIGVMVVDVIENSQDGPAIRFSPEMLAIMNELKDWLFENVYLSYPDTHPDTLKAQAIVRELFLHFAVPGRLPDGFSGTQGAVDYVSGMTDRFAIETFAALRLPQAFRNVGE